MEVFINCPLDAAYLKLLRPLLFALIYLRQRPRTAIEDTRSDRNRLQKIIELMQECPVSIHDLSRVKSAASGEFSRMNMPFELGVDYGLLTASKKPLNKRFIVLEEERYSYQKALSDYSGFDILCHEGQPARLVKVIRDWFVNNQIVDEAEGATAIWYGYNECWGFIFDRLVGRGYSEDETAEIPHREFTSLVEEWIERPRR
jgi:hypothetical protein